MRVVKVTFLSPASSGLQDELIFLMDEEKHVSPPDLKERCPVERLQHRYKLQKERTNASRRRPNTPRKIITGGFSLSCSI